MELRPPATDPKAEAHKEEEGDDDPDEMANGTPRDVEKWEESHAHFEVSSPQLSSYLFEDLERAGNLLEGNVSPSISPRQSHDSGYSKFRADRASPSLSPGHSVSPRPSVSPGPSISPGRVMSPAPDMYPGPPLSRGSPLSPRPPLSPGTVASLGDDMSPGPTISPAAAMSPESNISPGPSTPPRPSLSPQFSELGRSLEQRAPQGTSPLRSQGLAHTDGMAQGGSGIATAESLKVNDFENKGLGQVESSTVTSAQDAKVNVDRSIRTALPAFTQSVISAAKNIQFPKKSVSFRSSPAIYASKPWLSHASSRQMKITEVILRAGSTVLSLIAFAVMAATRETRSGAGSTFVMKFSDFQAYCYLVALNVLFFIYSGWHVIQLGQSSSKRVLSGSFNSRLYIVACDQILAFLLVSASSSAATASQLSRHGLRNIWPPACSTWSLWLFCAKADAAVVMSFFSSFFAISCSLFSAYQLSKSLAD